LGGWEDRGGILESEVITTKWGTNDLSIFGIGTNSAMYWQHWNGASWSGWISLGGIFTSVPAAVSWGAGRIDVLASAAMELCTINITMVRGLEHGKIWEASSFLHQQWCL
jgi:hypothetical protein